MKKTLSILIVLMVVSSVVFARKSDNPTTGIAVLRNGSVFKLLYKAESTNVQVLIFDDNNQVIFTDRIKNVDGFIRPYDFSRLPEGNYRIELTDINGHRVEKIAYREKREEKTATILPVAGSVNKFILFVPYIKPETITIEIFDQWDNLVLSQDERISGDFAKIYNLEKFQGRITFNVTDSRGNTKALVREIK